jgi:fatty acid desaturase
MLARQVPKFYFLAIAWPVYLFFLPFVFASFGGYSLLFVLFPGVYLFTWLACLMHECWHKYVPDIPINFFYNIFSYMLLTDPQTYRLVHGNHHSKVNSWEDFEFHPIGEIKNDRLRRLYNLAEILFGVMFTFGMQMSFLPRHPKYKEKYSELVHLFSMAMWVIIYGSIGILSAITFGLTARQVVIPFLINFWLGSVFIHHVQLIEHGGKIVEGDVRQRMLSTRNLKFKGFFEKIFHFLTHSDSREHVIHHTDVAAYDRPFPGRVPMPEGAVFISLRDYMTILWCMVTKG